MTIAEIEAHSRAIVSIQALLSKLSPGTSPYRIAERALDLAFNKPLDSGASPVREMLAEAEILIQQQLRAKLLCETPTSTSPATFTSKHHHARPRHLAWRGTLRPRAFKRFVQSRLWLTIEGPCGDVHVHIR